MITNKPSRPGLQTDRGAQQKKQHEQYSLETPHGKDGMLALDQSLKLLTEGRVYE